MALTKRAYKFRFYPTEEQAQNLAQTFGCCRFVYNWALNKRKRAYFDHGVKLYTKDLSAAIVDLKRAEGTVWLKDVSSVPLQQALRHLDDAYKYFFKHLGGYPTFKKRHDGQSATYASNAFQYNAGQLTLAKQSEPLAIHWSRHLPKDAKPSSVTVSRDKLNRYFVSILIEEDIRPLEPTEQSVGVDVGLKSFVVLSTGESVSNPKYYAKSEKRLATLQKRHSKKQKGSKNREKARRKVAKLHAHVVAQRNDFQHKLSTRLIRENQVVCVETLAVKNMVKNPKLSKAISDVGWSEFIRQLEYKAKWYGRTLVKIDRWFPSSKTCSACGHVMETLTLDVREWTCPICGVVHDRDINAAKNIHAEGHSVLKSVERIEDERVPKGTFAILSEAENPIREGGNPPGL